MQRFISIVLLGMPMSEYINVKIGDKMIDKLKRLLVNTKEVLSNISLYDVLLTIDSISLLATVYLIKSSIWIPIIRSWSVAVYILIPLVLAWFCLIISDNLELDPIEGGISSIELANDSYLPNYLGYFFVALSIPDNNYTAFLTVFGIAFFLLLFSRNIYYNPLFLLQGYHFYHIGISDGVKILIITKAKLKSIEGISFPELRKINDYTFIEKD